MRCRSCDYPLWNLTTRLCPECGASFAIGDYELVPHKVEFRCPHCEHGYAGTGPKGHLVPSRFDCTGCGRGIDMDEMLLQPAPGVLDDETRPDRMPWFERRRRGRVKAWFATVGMALIRPCRLIRGVPPSSSIGAAWWYATLTQTLVAIFRLLPAFLLLVPLMVGVTRQAASGGRSPPAALIGGLVLVGLALMIVITLGLIVVWGLASHTILYFTGRTDGGLRRTYQALCYSSGANIASAVPCLGDFGFVWWIVSAILMIKDGHRIGGGRATAAVLGPGILLIGSVAILGVVMIGRAAMTSRVTGAQSAQIVGMMTAVTASAEASPPGHGLTLIADARLGAAAFIAENSATRPEDVPVATGTLATFARLTVAEQREIAIAAVRALPDGAVAHRVGDFVFTFHGVDPATGPPGLWMVVMSPEPDANPDAAAMAMHWAGCLGGGTQQIEPGDLVAALARQNELRATLGLAPLPAPSTVTHDAPAVADPDR